MSGKPVMHRSTHDSPEGMEWETPPDVLAMIQARWGPIILDVCATAANAKAPHYFDQEQDALRQDWGAALERARKELGLAPGVGVAFMNPRYNVPEQPCDTRRCKKRRCVERGWHAATYIPGQLDFMRKARREAIRHRITVVTLPACRPETDWWRTYVTGAEEDLDCDLVEYPGAWRGGLVYEGGERLMRWERLETTIVEWSGRIAFTQPDRKSSVAGFPSAVVCYRGLRLGQ